MDVRKEKAKRNETPNMKLQIYPCSLGDPTFFSIWLMLLTPLDFRQLSTWRHLGACWVSVWVILLRRTGLIGCRGVCNLL